MPGDNTKGQRWNDFPTHCKRQSWDRLQISWAPCSLSFHRLPCPCTIQECPGTAQETNAKATFSSLLRRCVQEQFKWKYKASVRGKRVARILETKVQKQILLTLLSAQPGTDAPYAYIRTACATFSSSILQTDCAAGAPEDPTSTAVPCLMSLHLLFLSSLLPY